MQRKKSKTKCVGILTAGGDCPGLNAAIRGVSKAVMQCGISVVGIIDGFRGLVENRTVALRNADVSGILTRGGTIIGTSRDKPHKMPMGERVMDMTDVAIDNAKRLRLDCLICLGGNGTQKNALRLHQSGGINVMTLPKTIDNDVYGTDITFGFDTALSIATEAIDRLHTTATSHHRVIICEIMGHRAGWLALAAGIAGGADVILIPEIPYDINVVTEHLINRRHSGKKFSIIAIAEGAVSIEEVRMCEKEKEKTAKREREKKKIKKEKKDEIRPLLVREPTASVVARQLQLVTGIEARVTTLGHVQRGGIPSPTDRLLCTRLGTKAGQLLRDGVYNVMVAVKGNDCVPVPLEKVAGRPRNVPVDHPWIETAQMVDTCLGFR
jgi:6-phosphofructokinase